uniref:Ku domain-containing protein n=1 Tax=Gongylonema pulchrum TaxID=637853 RepID=A0A183E088_9BILA
LINFFVVGDILSAFKEVCGGHGRCDYSEALFLCIKRITSRSPHFQKRVVYLFTNDVQPFGNNRQHCIAACKNADDLRSHNAEFSVYPLIPEDHEQLDPNVQKNFENISELENDIPRKQYARRNIAGLDFEIGNGVKFSVGIIPRKQYARRNIAGLDFEIGNGVKFSVGIYALLGTEKLPQPIVLDAEENEIVQRSHTYINKETGDEMPLLDREIIRRRQVGGETVDMSPDEIDKLRRITLPGLLLLGFKPLSCLKISHHIRCSQFVYPLEKEVLGSTLMYRTLYEVCMKQKKMMICRYTQKANEEISSKFRYAGFHLVYLPYAEDKRDLSEQMTHPDGEWPKASKEQIEAARGFVKKLTASYFPEKFCNPVLQKHYKVIEALALDYAEMPEVKDQIQPYFVHDAFRKRVEKELDSYRTATLPDDYNPEEKKKKETKTKRTDDSSRFLKRKPESFELKRKVKDLRSSKIL